MEAEGSAVTQATERRAESQAARPADGTGERGGSRREAPGT